MAHKVLLDVDPGIDDSIAIMLALRSPELEVLGLTTVAGNVPADLGAENACRVLELLNISELPVVEGEAKPLVLPLVTAQDTHGQDGLGETYLPKPSLSWQRGGVQYILDCLEENPGLTIIALGPLTNIARALTQKPESFANLARLIVMGGVARGPGNMSPWAEFNFWCDPHAAKLVFQGIQNITMVGLDVTRKLVLTPDHRELLYQFNTDLSRFIHAITRFYVDYHWFHEGTLGCVLNDPLALFPLLAPELLIAKPAWVEIGTQGEERGKSSVDFDSDRINAQVCLEVDAQAVLELLFYRLCSHHLVDIKMYFTGARSWRILPPSGE